jgi:hypothetical protein
MQHLDGVYVEQLMARLGRLRADAVPRWGRLRGDTLIEHLIWIVRHSMGRSRKVPFVGNWLTVRVIGPLAVRGWIPTPHNLQLPRSLRAQGIELREPGDLETLHALLEEYLNLVQADELRPGLHPLFGDLGVDGWDRVHVLHFEYHLRQFGV